MEQAADILRIFEPAALAAGRAIMEVRSAGAHTQWKADHSPVTEADIRAERIILDHLSRRLPGLPVIAEEAVAAGRIPDISEGDFILVDPLDGTREFVNGHDDFTVNIALIRQGEPVAGFVYAPALAMAYAGAQGRAEKLGIGPDFDVVERTAIATRPTPQAVVTVASRSHRTPETDDFLKTHRLSDCRSVGSSLKFGLVAEGLADIYPRFSRTMQWDTAAGDAVLRAAGGMTFNASGKPLRYGAKSGAGPADFANPFFLACGSAERCSELLRDPLFAR